MARKTTATGGKAVHPALYSWREQLLATFVHDHLTLLSASSEPKIGTLFAKSELKRGFCGQHDPILTPTPKYKLLWKALADRPEPRRIGR